MMGSQHTSGGEEARLVDGVILNTRGLDGR